MLRFWWRSGFLCGFWIIRDSYMLGVNWHFVVYLSQLWVEFDKILCQWRVAKGSTVWILVAIRFRIWIRDL